jgi:ABC-type transporter Mla subunit MlaD
VDVEQTIEFILDTQARLEASVGQHDAQLREIKTSVAALTDRVTAVTGSVATLSDLVGRLAQAEIGLVGRMDQLAESQTHTDQRLNALIDVVDKLVSRNGHDQ